MYRIHQRVTLTHKLDYDDAHYPKGTEATVIYTHNDGDPRTYSIHLDTDPEDVITRVMPHTIST